MPTIPKVAIVGRANVGKSTLFNRLLESRKALVSSIPGTTRDRAHGECVWRGQVIEFIDTGGVDIKHPDDIEAEIIRQANVAMEEADVILFLVDAQVHVTDFDRDLATRIEKLGKPMIIAANKADTAKAKSSVNEVWSWYHGEPMYISSVRSHGVGDLLDEIFEALKKIGKPAVDIIDVQATRVTVIGKPNVGKSSLLNKMLGKKRFIVSDVEHTTREPNDTTIKRKERNYVFVDTAGIRKKAMKKKMNGLEKLAVAKSLSSIKRSDIVLFVVEAHEKIGAQERVLAGNLSESDAGIIIVVNKWDLVEDKKTNTMKDYEKEVRFMLPMLKYAPIIFVSATKGQRTEKIFDLIDQVQLNRYTQIDPDELERFLRRAIVHHRPQKGMGTAPPKILGLKQVMTAPPKFELALKSRFKKKLKESYVRYLENRLHDEFELSGSPSRVYIKPVQGGK